MNIFVVYCHPSSDSFTKTVLDTFVIQCRENGHFVEVSDLYNIKFSTDMTEEEYLREANYDEDYKLNQDVIEEQNKINKSDVIVFIYPVFWTEAPAKLVGWFDRVWTYGFAYGSKQMKYLSKSIFLCVAGRTIDHLRIHGQFDSMKNVMIGDRMHERAKVNKMYILDGMSKANADLRNANYTIHIETVRQVANTIDNNYEEPNLGIDL